MKVYYSSNKLERILNNPRLIKKHYSKIYNKLMVRLSELRVAESLADISPEPPPRRHKLIGPLKECWGIDVSKNCRIIVQPQGEYNEYELYSIKEIVIKNIDDYH